MKKITKLTAEQIARFPEWADKWIKIGLCTDEADWDTFGNSLRIAYERAGIPFPNKIIRVQSPIVGAFASSIAESIFRNGTVRDAVVDAVVDAVGDAVDDAVRGAVGGAVRGAVVGAVDDAVRGAVRGAVGDAVDDAVRGAVDDAVRGAVGGAVGGAVKRIKWHYWLGGQFWVGGWWGGPAFVSFLTDVCGLELPIDIAERALAYRKICESVNHVWPNKSFVMVCNRPKFIKKDEQGRLHSQTGHAIQYRDGWGISAWHGTVIPDIWITDPLSLTPKIALQQENLDKRRAACEILGWHRILTELNAVSINKHESEMIGELFEVDLPDSGKERFLVCCDYAGGKKRTFALNVPLEMRTAHEANALTWGYKPNEYQPEIET